MFFDWLELDLGKVRAVPIACQVLSVRGQRARSYRRKPLIKSADALVFVAKMEAVQCCSDNISRSAPRAHQGAVKAVTFPPPAPAG
jgi:hypothetical protein